MPTVQIQSSTHAVDAHPSTAPDHDIAGTDSNGVPIHVSDNRTLRVKIIDACGLTCSFCHNEGTPVTSQNRGNRPGEYIQGGSGRRQSIYLRTNGSKFLSSAMQPNESLRFAITSLCSTLDLDEVHLTGGEPTLHPKLPEIVSLIAKENLNVRMTSNGESGSETVGKAAQQGLESISFSIFGTTSQELASTQSKRVTELWSQDKLNKMAKAIYMAMAMGVKTKANIVIPNESHLPRVHHLLSRFGTDLSVRLLGSLADGERSTSAINSVLKHLGATPIQHQIIAGSSDWRTIYRTASGRIIHVKKIRRSRLPSTCSKCPLNSGTDCHEGFYGVRLYRDQNREYHVGVCIQRMDLCMSLEKFVKSPLASEIASQRKRQLEELLHNPAEYTLGG